MFGSNAATNAIAAIFSLVISAVLYAAAIVPASPTMFA